MHQNTEANQSNMNIEYWWINIIWAMCILMKFQDTKTWRDKKKYQSKPEILFKILLEGFTRLTEHMHF